MKGWMGTLLLKRQACLVKKYLTLSDFSTIASASAEKTTPSRPGSLMRHIWSKIELLATLSPSGFARTRDTAVAVRVQEAFYAEKASENKR